MSWGGPEAPQPQLRQTPAAPEQALSPPPSPQPSPVSRGDRKDRTTKYKMVHYIRRIQFMTTILNLTFLGSQIRTVAIHQ
ncbi:hypothetical protein LUU34_01053100 [Aix galericulata]|nr:hypothetical protein LUU34_01053100 [Aix galericulata]